MTSQISAHGRLGADPKATRTKNDSPMAFASMAVNLPKRSNGEPGEYTLWLSLVAFGKQADTLGRHEKGDLISVAGNLQINEYKRGDDEARTDFQVVIDSLVSARSAHPGKPTSAEEGFHQAERNHDY